MRVDDHGSHKGCGSAQLKQRVQASLLCRPCTLSWQIELTGGNLTWRQNLPGHENLNVFLLIKTFTSRSWFKSRRNRRMAEANQLSHVTVTAACAFSAQLNSDSRGGLFSAQPPQYSCPPQPDQHNLHSIQKETLYYLRRHANNSCGKSVVRSPIPVSF